MTDDNFYTGVLIENSHPGGRPAKKPIIKRTKEENNMASKQTRGVSRVCVDFNPSQDERVTAIKTKAADLIDYINIHCMDMRCKTLAMNDVESASMWAVKSLFRVESSK